MANTAAADAEDLPEGGNAKPAKSKKKLMMIGGGILLLAALGAGYFFFFTGKPAEKQEVVKSYYYDLPEMTVNLSASSERPQYLRVKITLEMGDNSVSEALKKSLPRVIDTFQVHMRELRAVDLEGSAGLYRLREELLRRINAAIAPAKIRQVLFKEVVIQ